MNERRDIDDLLVDWLYDELDPEEARRLEDELAGSEELRARADALQRTRSSLGELPDEEPPAAVSAILLHEAAVQAGAGRSESASAGGLVAWLGGLLRPLTMHPAVAAVATLVLVAGVAGTLYVRGVDEVARPTARSQAPAPAAGSVPERPLPAEEPAEEASERASDTGFVAELAPAETEQQLAEQRADRASDGDRAAERKAKKKPRGATGRAEPAKGETTTATRRAAADKAPQPAPKQSVNAVSSADAPAEGGLIGGAQPRAAGGGGEPAATAAGPEAAYRAERAPAADDGWSVAEQARELERAVADRKCREAARIANDIRERDPALYAKRFASSKEVERCRWYVEDERKRRVARRKAAREEAPAKADADAETRPAGASD